VTEFQDGILITFEDIGYQAHAIKKAIRPFLQIWSHLTNAQGHGLCLFQ